MRDAQSKLQATRTADEAPRPFPPPRDFSSLSVAELIEAREAHYIQLTSLENDSRRLVNTRSMASTKKR